MSVRAPPPATRARFGRRRLLVAAITSGSVAALGSLVALVRSRGYEVPPGTQLVALAPWQYVVVRDLARRICAADEPGVVTADETEVATFVDAYVSKMPRNLRRDLLRFLGFIEQLAPAALGMASRFTRLSPTEQDRVLASLEAHRSDLLRGGWAGVKALVFMGYYRDPRTWRIAGYDGPLLGRPGG